MKILFGKFGHEANSFAGKTTDFESYSKSGSLVAGDALFTYFAGKKSDYISGMIEAAEEEKAELIPTVAALTAAPTLSDTCVEKMLDLLLPSIQAHRDEIDGICLGLHGAGMSESTDDLESYVLSRIRKITGNQLPIMITLDLHANLSERMLELSDAIFGIKQYPHIDMHDAGYLAMKVLIRTIRSGKKPECAIRGIPMMISLAAGYTFQEPFLSISSYFRNYIEQHHLIDATLFHGFPPADTPYTRASVAVVAEEGAQQAADELAEYIWERRNDLESRSLSPSEALDIAFRTEGDGYIVINELSDNPGGGTPGDGTHLLREMLKRNYPKSIFGYLYDPFAVEELCRYQVGETVNIIIGGRTEKIHGEPLEIRNAEIQCISNGRVNYVSPVHKGLEDSIGKCVRIRIENVDIIIGSILHQTYDDRPFLVTGADVSQYRYVGLKSAHHFRAFFEGRALAIITADPPGLMSGNLERFQFIRAPRPVFPLDRDVQFP